MDAHLKTIIGKSEQIVDVVDQIHWIPEFGQKRELDWLRNMHDWMISKKRYWGLAIPIWVCEDCPQQFDRKDRYDNHEHVKARKADIDYVDYSLIGLDTELGKSLMTLKAVSPLQALKVCLERFWAVAGFFPLLHVPVTLRQSSHSFNLWKESANTNGTAMLEQVHSQTFLLSFCLSLYLIQFFNQKYFPITLLLPGID